MKRNNWTSWITGTRPSLVTARCQSTINQLIIPRCWKLSAHLPVMESAVTSATQQWQMDSSSRPQIKDNKATKSPYLFGFFFVFCLFLLLTSIKTRSAVIFSKPILLRACFSAGPTGRLTKPVLNHCGELTNKRQSTAAPTKTRHLCFYFFFYSSTNWIFLTDGDRSLRHWRMARSLDQQKVAHFITWFRPIYLFPWGGEKQGW